MSCIILFVPEAPQRTHSHSVENDFCLFPLFKCIFRANFHFSSSYGKWAGVDFEKEIQISLVVSKDFSLNIQRRTWPTTLGCLRKKTEFRLSFAEIRQFKQNFLSTCTCQKVQINIRFKFSCRFYWLRKGCQFHKIYKRKVVKCQLARYPMDLPEKRKAYLETKYSQKVKMSARSLRNVKLFHQLINIQIANNQFPSIIDTSTKRTD